MAAKEDAWVEHHVQDDGAILFKVTRNRSGKLAASFRVFGRVKLPDGREYECDRDEVRVSLRKARKDKP